MNTQYWDELKVYLTEKLCESVELDRQKQIKNTQGYAQNSLQSNKHASTYAQNY